MMLACYSGTTNVTKRHLMLIVLIMHIHVRYTCITMQYNAHIFIRIYNMTVNIILKSENAYG